MHDEQAPPVTPGAQSDLTAEDSLSGGAPATEFDVELPFDSADPTAAEGAADAGVETVLEAPADALVEAPEPAAEGVAPAAPAAPAAADAPADGAAESADGPAEEAISTDDPEEAILRKLALLAEAEAIVATPDKNESGNAPDDRHLTERMRAVENVWRRVGPAGDREVELRTRLQDLRQAYAAARSRRAESRAVDRARAGETKRALLVQAFALAQQVDPSIALPAAPAPRAARSAPRRRPSPAMLARKPASDVPPADETRTESAPGDASTPTEETAQTVADVPGDAPGELVAVELVPDAPVPDAPVADAPVADGPAPDVSPAAETALAHEGAGEA